MKAINFRHDFLRAIAFTVLTIFLVSCTSCCDEPVLKAVVTIQDARNVSATSATFVALVTPNQDNTTVTFEYNSASDATWKTIVSSEKYSGSVVKEVTCEAPGLQPSVQYNYRAKALNNAGETISSLKSFITIGLTPAVVTLKSAIVKIDSAVIIATLVPNQVATSLSVEYKPTLSATWQTKSWPTNFSGNTLVTISFDVTGLEANTDYDFRVKSLNVAGEVVSSIISSGTYGAVDYDRNYYHAITIGTQIWLKENFKGTHYSNGDAIVNVIDQTAWANQTAGAYCYYDNDPENGKVYGALYNWYAATDSRSLIVGYHTPSNDEWETTRTYLGGVNVAGGKLKEVGTTHWRNVSAGTTNSTDFTALPSGQRTPYIFTAINEAAVFWTSSVYPSSSLAYDFFLLDVSANLQSGGNSYVYGQSIRLVKN